MKIIIDSSDKAVIETLKFYMNESRRMGVDQQELLHVESAIERIESEHAKEPNKMKIGTILFGADE